MDNCKDAVYLWVFFFFRIWCRRGERRWKWGGIPTGQNCPYQKWPVVISVPPIFTLSISLMPKLDGELFFGNTLLHFYYYCYHHHHDYSYWYYHYYYRYYHYHYYCCCCCCYDDDDDDDEKKSTKTVDTTTLVTGDFFTARCHCD